MLRLVDYLTVWGTTMNAKRFICAILSMSLAAAILYCGSPIPRAGDDTSATDARRDTSARKTDPARPSDLALDEKEYKSAAKRGDKKSNGRSRSDADAPSGESKPSTAKRERRPGASGLKAGFVDDNEQFNRYLEFLKKFGNTARNIPFDIGERIIIRVRDANGKPAANALVTVKSGYRTLLTARTYADGTVLFFPVEYGSQSSYRATAEFQQQSADATFERTGKREVVIQVKTPRAVMQRVPLDILFVFDTTGSMGEEINRLKKTLEIIYLNLTALSTKPLVRFGMVLYRDRGDDYVTKVVPFTEDIDAFQKELAEVSASGGGDYPEDLQEALHDAIKKMKWNRDGIRLGYIITDAPAHLDYGQSYTYTHAVKDARANAIKFFSIGTGGLTIDGEYQLRQIAQYTYGRYIFLTYGEKGDSAGGAPGSVSHHVGANFETDKLESIIMRFARKELSYLTDKPLDDGEGYFQANRIGTEDKKDTVKKLFTMAIGQLVDFSSIAIAPKTRAAVMPIGFDAKNAPLKLNAEYFTEHLILSLGSSKKFTMVERKDLQRIMRELELQMAGLVDQGNAAKVGKMMGAEVLIYGQLYRKKDHYELFIKLVRVETAEVLSVTRARIDTSLGL